MKKHFTFRSLLMVSVTILALVFTSCTKAYKKVIPADAPLVVEVNTKNLALKADLADQREDIAKMIQAIDPKDKDLKKLADAIREGEDAGLDLKNPLYFFATSDLENVFFVASVRSKDDIVDKLDEYTNGMVSTTEDGKKLWVTVGGQLVGVITSKVLLVGSANDKDTYNKMLDNSNHFFKADAGKFFKKNAGDITVTVNLDAIPESKQKELRRAIEREAGEACEAISEENWEKIFESQVLANLEFKTGEIDLNLAVKSEKCEDAERMIQKVSKETLQQIPSRNLIGLISVGIQGKEYCKAIDEALQASGVRFSGEEQAVYIMLKDMLNKMDGTMAAAFFAEDLNKDPEFLALVPTDFNEVEPLLDLFKDEIPSEISINGDSKSVYITNIRGYNGKANQSFDKAGDATSSYLYGFVDAEPIVDIAFTELTRRTIPEENKLLNSVRALCDLADYLELKADETDKLQLRLVLNKDNKNALSLILTNGIKIGNAYIEYENARRASYYDDFDFDFDEEDAIEAEAFEWDEDDDEWVY